jgi:hypothetical protein
LEAESPRSGKTIDFTLREGPSGYVATQQMASWQDVMQGEIRGQGRKPDGSRIKLTFLY